MQSIPLGVVVERRRIDHPWQDHEWRPVAVIPGAPEAENPDEWKELARGDGWVRYLAGSLPLELHRKETEAYKVNLSNDPPVIYVVLSETDAPDAAHEVEPSLVTASPYDAQDYEDAGEELLDGVPMPDPLIAWIADFIERHHVDEPFHKRKRKRYDPNDVGFGPRPDGPGQRRTPLD
jgi:hypothetical protein